MVTLGAALVALLSGNPPVAALQSSASVSPATMPAIATIDDRFESYNVEMADWVTESVKRRPKNVAVVAMANKMARTIWALTAHERVYQSRYVSRPA